MTAPDDSVSLSIIERAEAALSGALEAVEDHLDGAVEALCKAHPEDAQSIRERVDAARNAAIGGLPAPASSEDDSSATVRADTFEPIGPYRPLAELGRGGQGLVYLAEDARLGRVVALKVLKGFGPLSEKMMHRFQREAAVASKLDHPGICAVYDAGVRDGVPFIAMRYVRGRTLAEKIRQARTLATSDATPSIVRDEDRAATDQSSSRGATKHEVLRIVEIVEKAARALHAAHEAGVIHRDVKPGNIMVTPAGDPVLLDFGLASEEANELSLTQSGDLFGTPAYMSPEQLMAQRVRVDRRTDVYSLGVTLYECISLRRPCDAPTRDAMYQAIQYKRAVDVRRLNPHVPADLGVVLEKALEKDRDRRYENALAFAEDLRRVRELKPVVAKPVSAAGRLARWAKRRPMRAALVAVLAIGTPLIVGLASYVVTKQPQLRAAEERATREQLEGHVEEGFLALVEGDTRNAVASFDAARAMDPDDPAAIGGKALALYRAQSNAACLDVLDRHPALEGRLPALARARIGALRALGRAGEAAERSARPTEPATTPLGLFFDAVWLSEPDASAQTGERVRQAFATATLAAMRSPRARLLFHHGMAQAVQHLDDDASRERTASSLVRVWPNSARAWYGAALAHKDRKAKIAALRRALELAPGSTRARTALEKLEASR